MYPDIRLLTPSGYPKYKITIRCSPNIYIYDNILYIYIYIIKLYIIYIDICKCMCVCFVEVESTTTAKTSATNTIVSLLVKIFNLVRLSNVSIRLSNISTTNCEALHKQAPKFV